jgi:hypothetical protein
VSDEGGQPMSERRRAIQAHLAGQRALRDRQLAGQEDVTGEALDALVGPVDSQAHGSVQGEMRRIQVAVRGQMDGIRPIEAVVLTYRWTRASGGWVFEEMETLVQGLDGTLKPGTVLNSADFHMLGPSLGWAWELGHAHWPRG